MLEARMRTTETFAWRRSLISVALCSLAGAVACSSGGGGHPSETGGDSGGDTGGNGGSGTGGKATGGTGGKATGGSTGNPDAGPSGGSGGDGGAGGSGTGGKGTGGSAGGSGGSTGGTGGSTGGSGGGGGGMPPAGTKKIAQHVITFYSFQDNTPVNSLFTASGRTLKQYSSVAVPFRELASSKKGGTLTYGDKLWLSFLAGRTMPNGTKHTGWVQVDDFCGDGGDDSYCFQQIDGKGPMYPNADLYIGDFSKSGFMPTPPTPAAPMGDCTGPSGSGLDLTDVYTGTPATFETNYGGALLGTGKCGDRQAARDGQFGPPKGAPFGDETAKPPTVGTLTACWQYDGQGPDTSGCSACVAGVTCAK
jgi:hypothetical protein